MPYHGAGPKDLDVQPQSHRDKYVHIAWCGDPSEHWAQLGATNGPFPEVYSQRWEIPIAEPEEEEEEPRSRVTVPGQEEESEDDGPILTKDGKLGSKKRGKN